MKKQRLGFVVGVLAVAMLSLSSVAGATVCGTTECVINGGFQTYGDLTGWTVSGNLPIDDASAGFDNTPGYTSDGSYYFWAANGLDMGYLSQTITTTNPGVDYTISFQLSNATWSPTLGEFTASFGGITLLDLKNPNSFDWTNFSYTVSGYTGTSAELVFGFSASPGWWSLDNVSVVDGVCYTNCETAPVPEPSTWLLFGSGLAGLVAWRYRTGKRAMA